MVQFMGDGDCLRSKEEIIKAIKDIWRVEWWAFIPEDLKEPLREHHGACRDTIVQHSAGSKKNLDSDDGFAVLISMLGTLVQAAKAHGNSAGEVRRFIEIAHQNRSPDNDLLRAETMVEALGLLVRSNAEKEIHERVFGAGQDHECKRLFAILKKSANAETWNRFFDRCSRQNEKDVRRQSDVETSHRLKIVEDQPLKSGSDIENKPTAQSSSSAVPTTNPSALPQVKRSMRVTKDNGLRAARKSESVSHWSMGFIAGQVANLRSSTEPLLDAIVMVVGLEKFDLIQDKWEEIRPVEGSEDESGDESHELSGLGGRPDRGHLRSGLVGQPGSTPSEVTKQPLTLPSSSVTTPRVYPPQIFKVPSRRSTSRVASLPPPITGKTASSPRLLRAPTSIGGPDGHEGLLPASEQVVESPTTAATHRVVRRKRAMEAPETDGLASKRAKSER